MQKETLTETEHDSASEAEKKRIMRSAYWWYTVAGTIFALQSVIMLMVLTRVCDVATAGVFTIAFANANLFMNLGKYGVRKFHVSDRQGEFSFQEYHRARIVTCVAMIAASAAYIAYSAVTLNYAPDKTFVIVMMCLFKATDAYEDLYTGAYQLEDRLDVGAKMLTWRQVFILIVFGVFAVAFADLPIAITATTVLSAAFLGGQIWYVKHKYHMPTMGAAATWNAVIKLLRECFALFLADFLLFYIGNAPKYAIDAFMDDATQAYYGYIAMPVFVVTLFAGFIYSPLVTTLTDQWRQGDVRGFLKRFLLISAAIFGITVVCVFGAWLVGVPVLDLLYNAQTGPYLAELLILVAGGGFLAVTTFITVGITIIRFQKVLAPLYIALAVLAWAVSNWTVINWGITGAAWAYFSVMAVSSVLFVATFAIGIKRNRKLLTAEGDGE